MCWLMMSAGRLKCELAQWLTCMTTLLQVAQSALVTEQHKFLGGSLLLDSRQH